MECLTLNKSSCRNCHKCIRHCPVKAIRFSGNQAYINQSECILCGHCFVVCPQDAKQIHSSIPQVKALLSGNAPVVASLAPSFIANYEGMGIEAMQEALQRLGFAAAEETALGATLVKREYDRLLEEEGRDMLISSCCPSVNLLIQKYYPSLLTYLADVLTPMQAHAQDIKRRIPGAKVVFIGPCIAKKEEAAQTEGFADAVLTFDELSLMLSEQHITPEKRLTPTSQGLTRIFPTAGGVLRTMKKANPAYTYMAVDGADRCLEVLSDLRDNRLHHCFIEMNMCLGGCLGGPVMEKHQHTPVRDYMAVSAYAGMEDFAISQPESGLLRKSFPVLPRRTPLPSEAEITKAMQSMAKFTKKDELNCGTCGYNTCREKAIAICQGKAEPAMCLPYLMARSQGFSDIITRNVPSALIVVNEQLEVQDINPAALSLLGIADASAIMGEDVGKLFDPAGLIEVLTTGISFRDRPIELPAQQKFALQTVLHDPDFHVLVCILRDITTETREKQLLDQERQHTVDTANRVIDHQMRVVQEIASLLGETAAETKIALTKLKESISHE